MIQNIWTSPQGGFQWIDVSSPSEAGLKQLAKMHDLPRSVVRACLEPDHLPKVERFPTATFVILRAYDEKADEQGDTVQELTRKIAIFRSEKFVLSIHRKDQPFLAEARRRVNEKGMEGCETEASMSHTLLLDLLQASVNTFEVPIEKSMAQLEQQEARIFAASSQTDSYSIQEGYFLRRRGAVFRRMLRLTGDVLGRLAQQIDVPQSHLQGVRETTERLYFQADDLLDNASTLLSLHISLSSQRVTEASHRTNEIVRLLTVSSVFFLPLNFIASIYGMNFEHIPGLHSEYGFPAALFGMVALSVAIFGWINRRGWLRSSGH